MVSSANTVPHDSVKVTLPLRVHMAMDKKVVVFVNGESVFSVLYQSSIP
jgi:hypothetical protein